MSVNVSASVVRILKETYEKDPELSAYKITTHKNKLSSFVEDPSLWVNLSSSGKPPDTTTEAVIHPDALQKRLELLKKASSEEGLSPTLVGVVTELWTINEGWKGHATCHSLGGQSLQVSKGYLFDWRSPCVIDPQLGLYPLHIGDDISFQVVQSEQSVAPGTLLVTKYNTCLKLLEWPAPWNCILAEEKLYYKYYVQILKVYDFCANAPEIDLLHRNKQQLMNTLHDSQFILNINNVLTKADCGQDRVKDEADGGQDRAKDEAKLLNVAVSLLCAVVKIKKNGCQLLSGPVKEFLCGGYPHGSDGISPGHTPNMATIPTNEELQKIIEETEESHCNLPEVKVTYSSAMEYGHTYFSLLRADCYYPLCEKIARLKVKKDDSYYELTFMEVITSSRKPVVFGFGFKWKNSPEDTSCLEQGNLLCLSLGGKFEEDFIWATVEHTDGMKGKRFKEVVDHVACPQGTVYMPVHQGQCTYACPQGTVYICLSTGDSVHMPVHRGQCTYACPQGTVYICLCSEFNTLPDEECMEQLRRSRNVVAVKSPAYFRAYQPVLDALKELDLDHIHFL
ncbi:hypothetical protein EMCRGX_G006476 [Ephydatia muelleri]